MGKLLINTTTGAKTSVVVRKRLLSDGIYSLYLDINTKGQRTRENLQMYLLPGNSQTVKEKNNFILQKANDIASQRREEILNMPEAPAVLYAAETPFLQYFKKKAIEKKGEDISKWDNYRSTLRMLESYCKEDTMFTDITKEWVEGFKTFLDNVVPQKHTTIEKKHRLQGESLSFKTKVSYFYIFKQCIESAYKDRLLAENPFTGNNAVKCYIDSDYVRKITYLEWNDIQLLYDTPCEIPVLKRAFLLSCYTGTRYADVAHIRWADVDTDSNGNTIIRVPVKMSSTPLIIDVPHQAEIFLGERQSSSTLVFDGLKYNPAMLCCLRAWALRAGVYKDFTFYTARHSYIMFLLKTGLDPLDVMEIMKFKCKKNINVYVNQLKEDSHE